MTSTLFELQNVNHVFGSFQALTDVNLHIEAGERVALVGSSGAGKSTLLALLNGSILPTEGSVKVLGRETASLSPSVLRQTQSQIGTIHQQFHLVDALSVIFTTSMRDNWGAGR